MMDDTLAATKEQPSDQERRGEFAEDGKLTEDVESYKNNFEHRQNGDDLKTSSKAGEQTTVAEYRRDIKETTQESMDADTSHAVGNDASVGGVRNNSPRTPTERCGSNGATTPDPDYPARGDENSDAREAHPNDEQAGDGREGLNMAEGSLSNSGEREEGSTSSNKPPSLSQPALEEWPAYCDPGYRMPENLTVDVHVNNEVKSMSIAVERFTGKKCYEGGYRHRRTRKVFHHASAQFGQRKRVVKQTGHLRTRETQTYTSSSKTLQTTNECGTQMARKDMHFDTSRDTFKTPGDYQTAVEFWKIREERTITIQRYWRGFSARNRVWFIREEKWAQAEKEMEEAAAVEREKARRQEREMQRRMNPRTAQDFEGKILYNELDQWRDAETKRIKRTEVGERRKLLLQELLHKETRLLQTIDRLKITAAHWGKERRTRHMLELISTPKKWEMNDGEVAEVKTPWTERARELQELYEALEAPLLSVEERLDVLLHLKWTVSEFDCRLTRDITELVDREADLLSRGRGEASLRPLRQRIRNLFLRFVETPDFNPEVTRFVRVPPKYDKLTKEGVAGLTTVSCS